ncbi:MAG: carboxypeptidase-like regulatory domain-containing protein [Gammaproteobacteria bacterium]|nr:carboxypeptidase-like regulatory domain-containing protein [Gammaproteobacteria bacterium]
MALIGQVNEQIKQWLNDIVKGVDVQFCAPKDYEKNNQICVYLTSLEKMMGNTNPLFIQIKLKYLITICSESDEQAHDIMSQLLLSDGEHPVFNLLPDLLPIEHWQAFKIIPRPLFSLTYVLDIPRIKTEAPLVEQQPNIVTTPMSPIFGTLLDQNNKPLSNCRVELSNRSVLTDRSGRFDLGQVSTASPSIITIYTRTDNQKYSYKHEKYNGQEITISLTKLEDNNA